MQPKRRQWGHTVLTLLVVLLFLLVVLACFAVIYVLYSVLHRFGQVLFLFGLGSILAYVLMPVVDRLQLLVRKRWIAILIAYITLVLGLLIIMGLLFTPFVQQSQSLVDNLKNPAPSSLESVSRVQKDIRSIQRDLLLQQQTLADGTSLPTSAVRATGTHISTLDQNLTKLQNGTAERDRQTAPIKRGTKLEPQMEVPPSYLSKVKTKIRRLSRDYRSATRDLNKTDPNALDRSINDSRQAAKEVKTIHQTVATTPVLLLRAQTWVDQRGAKFDLHDNFGKAIRELSNRGAALLNNAVGILSKAATVLVNTILVLIISIYFLSDGPRLIRRGVAAIPRRYREQANFFVHSTDTILGGYLRGQIVLALLAGILGGGGAVVLGVPYPVLIGISTFFLELIPVIGPLILIVPPLVISLIFMPFTSTLILLIYFMAFQQVVTNIIGPRVVGTAVGIHPLAAMAAALIGYPLAGFLGSFLAVPAMGILHILLREAYREFVLNETFEEATEVADEPKTRSATSA